MKSDEAGLLIGSCDYILDNSTHVYTGGWDDCQVLTKLYNREVYSCRNFAVEGPWLLGLLNITEATFDNGTLITAVMHDNVPVLRYWKNRAGEPPIGYDVLSENAEWQIDVLTLVELSQRGAPI